MRLLCKIADSKIQIEDKWLWTHNFETDDQKNEL